MTPQIIVIEGADATGKTTFAERYKAANHPTYVLHNGPPPAGSTSRSLYEMYLNQIIVAIHRRDVLRTSVVIDRSFLGEIIYGRHRSTGPLLSRSQVRHLERYCRRNGVLLLGFEASMSTRKARHAERGERWTPLAAFTGPEYSRYFHSRRGHKYWVTADTSSAHTVTQTEEESDQWD